MSPFASPPTGASAGAARRPERLAQVVAGLQALRAERVFLGWGLPFGLLLLALTPPFQVPDEPAHFFRAYAISEGQLFAGPLDAEGVSGSGNILPVSLSTSATRLVGNVPFHPELRVDPSMIVEELGRPLHAEKRAPTQFTGASVYFPVVYAPQAVGMWAARALGGTPLWLLYGGRLLNLLVALAITAWAIRLAPIHRWTMALIALSPLVAFTRSSVSADGLTTALAFLLVALVLREALARKGEVGWPALAAIAAVGALLGLCKPTYFLMSAAVLLIPVSRHGSRPRQLWRSAAVLLASALPTVAWSRKVSGLYVPDTQPAPNPPEQLAWALAHPLRVVRTVLEAPIAKADWYFDTALGRLGWLDTPLPAWAVAALAVMLVALALLDSGGAAVLRGPLTHFQRLWAPAVAVTVMYAIFATLFLAWNPVGATAIEGVQGRYFLPLLPLALVALHRAAPPSERGAALRTALCLAALLLVTSTTAFALATRYYG